MSAGGGVGRIGADGDAMGERILLIPYAQASVKHARKAWHQRPWAGCVVLALFSLFGLACVSLPSFESPGNITVFRVSDADMKLRDDAGWREVPGDPPERVRHAVTLALRQERDAIVEALHEVSDPDSPKYGQHLTQEQVAELSTSPRTRAFVQSYLRKVTSALPVRVTWSPMADYVKLDAPVEDLNKIFNAKFRRWERRVNGNAVHATYRTRELAVPKDLEGHLDGVLGALHLPSGQLQHRGAGNAVSRGVGMDGDGDGGKEGVHDGGAGKVLAYSDREPVRINKPPLRRKVNETEWVRREAVTLAKEAGNDPFAVEAFHIEEETVKEKETTISFNHTAKSSKASIVGSGDAGSEPDPMAEDLAPVSSPRLPSAPPLDPTDPGPIPKLPTFRNEHLLRAPAPASAPTASKSSGDDDAKLVPLSVAIAAVSDAIHEDHEAAEDTDTSAVTPAAGHLGAEAQAPQQLLTNAVAAAEPLNDPDSGVRLTPINASLVRDPSQAAAAYSQYVVSKVSSALEKEVEADERKGKIEALLGARVRRRRGRRLFGFFFGAALGDEQESESETAVSTGHTTVKGAKQQHKQKKVGGEQEQQEKQRQAEEKKNEEMKKKEEEVELLRKKQRISERKKRRERKRIAEQNSEWEDKANLMFQKIQSDMEDMRTFMSDVVHKNADEVRKSIDEEEQTETDHDKVESDEGDPVKKIHVIVKKHDAQAVPTEKEEVGNLAPDDADITATEIPTVGSSTPTATGDSPKDGSSTLANDSSFGDRTAKTNAPRDEAVEVDVEATNHGNTLDDDADANGAQDVDDGGYYEYEVDDGNDSEDLNDESYDEDAYGADLAASAPMAAAMGPAVNYMFDTGTPSDIGKFDDSSGSSEQNVKSRAKADLAAVERHKSTLRHKLILEERLKDLVTPDKVLGYYNVPRGYRVTHAGASVAIGIMAGAKPHVEASVLKYAEYFNLSLGELSVSASRDEDDAEMAGAVNSAEIAADSRAANGVAMGGDRRVSPRDRGGDDGGDKVEGVEASVKATVAGVVRGTVKAAVDALDAVAEDAGLVVETGSGAKRSNGEEINERSREVAGKVDDKGGDSNLDAIGYLPTAGSAGERRGVSVAEGDDEMTPKYLDTARVEQNLDIQAVTAVAQGAPVDLRIASPQQHYGWEALDVLFSIASAPVLKSVISLSFGGAETASEEAEAADSSINATVEGLTRGAGPSVSTAPSYVRQSNSWDTLERMDTEIAKLGLRGVTVVAASGDNGQFSYGIPNPYLSWSSTDSPCAFGASFPGSMPHVTAVGGTTGGKDPFKPERAATVDLGSKITSGGGWSSVFPQPAWQKAAVEKYLKQYSYDLPPASLFNASNRAYPDVALAATDIALVFAKVSALKNQQGGDRSVNSKKEGVKDAVGEHVQVSDEDVHRPSGHDEAAHSVGSVLAKDTSGGQTGRRGGGDAIAQKDGSSKNVAEESAGNAVESALGRAANSSADFEDTDTQTPLEKITHYLTESSGTSYSAPLFAGMIALINDERIAMGKNTVGFINPALYSLHRTSADVFRDVKTGSSKCPNPAMTGVMVGCCKHGFRAGKGWDPLTGLGSIDFMRLRDELLKLP